MPLDKTEIARRQLGAALAMFINDNDPVSVHVLACGGGEVAEQLSVKAGEQPFSSHILSSHPDMDKPNLVRIRNQYWNAFKHATSRSSFERDDQETLASFEDSVNDHVLFLGWYDFMLATSVLPVEAQVFQAWYYAMYPEKVGDGKIAKDSIILFGNLREIPRAEAKNRMRVVIKHTRETQPEVMNSDKTDKRSLVIDPLPR